MFYMLSSQAEKYFKKHTAYNSWAHGFGGIGVGILLARPIAASHPVRWAVIFLAISAGMHLYTLTKKTK